MDKSAVFPHPDNDKRINKIIELRVPLVIWLWSTKGMRGSGYLTNEEYDSVLNDVQRLLMELKNLSSDKIDELLLLEEKNKSDRDHEAYNKKATARIQKEMAQINAEMDKQQSYKTVETRGRKKGSGTIDDEKYLVEMNRLCTDKVVASAHQAAIKIIIKYNLSNNDDASIKRRLLKKYSKKYDDK